MQRVALINWKNINQDYDLAKIFSSLSTSWVIEWLEVQSWKVTPWYAFIDITRDSNTFPILFQNSADVVIDTTWTKKVYIEITQSNIDDWNNNNADWTWIWEIKTNSTYPTSNFVKLASITAWVITDEREYIQIKDILKLIWLTQNITTTWDITANQFYWDWSNLSWIISDVGATTTPTTTWENITIWNTLVLWANIDGALPADADEVFWRNSTQKRSQKFTIWATDWNITDVVLWLSKVSSPTDNLTVRIETDNAGNPSGTLADVNATAQIAWTTLTTVRTEYTLTFTWIFTLTAWSYHIVLGRSGSLNDSIYFKMWSSGQNVWTVDWFSYYWSWSSWIVATNHYMSFDLWVLQAWVYKSDASNINKINFVWFANATITTWNNIKLNTSWVDWNQTGLIAWKDYYLSNTPWEIQATPWTNKIHVWKAISSTEIKINNTDKYNSETYEQKTTWEKSVTYLAWKCLNTDASSYTWFQDWNIWSWAYITYNSAQNGYFELWQVPNWVTWISKMEILFYSTYNWSKNWNFQFSTSSFLTRHRKDTSYQKDSWWMIKALSTSNNSTLYSFEWDTTIHDSISLQDWDFLSFVMYNQTWWTSYTADIKIKGIKITYTS